MCVGFDAEVGVAALGPDGALAAMPPGSCLVVSTVSSQTMRALAVHAPDGVDVVDRPAIGGESAAVEGRCWCSQAAQRGASRTWR